MRLHDPWLLALLVLLPLVWRLLLRAPHADTAFPGSAGAAGGKARAARASAAAAAAAAHRRAGAAGRWRWRARRSAARRTEVHSEGIDIMLAVDVSSSMLAEDFAIDGQRVNRLDAVKVEVRRFLDKRDGDRVGLVLFGARPYLQAPLTLDHDWLLDNLDRAEVGMIEDGTAVGSALASAVRHLEASTAKSKIVVLLTDGESNAGRVSPQTAADAAATLGYKVYTIGAGSRGLAPYPVTDMFGNRRYRPTEVNIDEQTLREIAKRTGARYWRASGAESLKEVYAEIDRLEKSEHEGLRFMEFDELYLWVLIPAFLLLALEAVLSESWLRILP